MGWHPCCCVTGIQTDCCENPLPETLTLTVTHDSGSATCLDGWSFTLTWDSVDEWWISGSESDPCGSGTFTFWLECVSGNWVLGSSETGNCVFNLTESDVTCPSGETPFSIQYTGTWGGGSCFYGSNNVTVDITE